MSFPSFKSLHYFSVAGQLSSFKLAANALFVSQAAVSQQVKLLEEDIGTALFLRHGKQTQLTEAGERLLMGVSTGFRQIENSVDSVISSLHQKIVVSCPHSFANYCLIPKLGEFQSAHPDISVHIAPDNKMLIPSDFRADLAIRYGHAFTPNLETRELADSKLVLAFSPLLDLNQQQVADSLSTIPFLLDDSDDIAPALQVLCNKFNVVQSELNITLRVRDSVPIITGLLSGKGIGLVNNLLIKEFVTNGQLIEIDNVAIQSPLSFFAVAPAANFQEQKVAVFLNWLYSQNW